MLGCLPFNSLKTGRGELLDVPFFGESLGRLIQAAFMTSAVAWNHTLAYRLDVEVVRDVRATGLRWQPAAASEAVISESAPDGVGSRPAAGRQAWSFVAEFAAARGATALTTPFCFPAAPFLGSRSTVFEVDGKVPSVPGLTIVPRNFPGLRLSASRAAFGSAFLRPFSF